MGAACVNGAGRSLPLRISRRAAYVAGAQTETLLFSTYIGLCRVTHQQKERRWKGMDATMSDLHCTWCSHCSWWKNFTNYWLNCQHMKTACK